MIILGIETSCDETAAAVVFGNRKNPPGRLQILSNIVASSANLQAKYGGVIPEQAAREQLKAIIPVIKEALLQAQCKSQDLNAIAITYGPGLIGSLLVGVETAKTLSMIWNKPLIPINHLLGHFYANWITPAHLRGVSLDYARDKQAHLGGVTFPCLGLLVSGGHTDLVLFEGHGKYKYLGGTRDDAAGECFDKCARLLGLPYPGGPHIAKLAQKGNPKVFDLPRPMILSDDFDFSFSGLKTAVANLVESDPKLILHNNPQRANLAASIQDAITDVLIKKTIKASQKYHIRQIMVAGGVAANKYLSEKLRRNLHTQIRIPLPQLCTDNAVMVAAAGFFQKPISNPLSLQADPSLSLLY